MKKKVLACLVVLTMVGIVGSDAAFSAAKQVKCSDCKGKGGTVIAKNVICTWCQGAGKKTLSATDKMAKGTLKSTEKCTYCSGKGKSDQIEMCYTCMGTGKVDK